jgi:hypothetical protein
MLALLFFLPRTTILSPSRKDRYVCTRCTQGTCRTIAHDQCKLHAQRSYARKGTMCALYLVVDGLQVVSACQTAGGV